MLGKFVKKAYKTGPTSREIPPRGIKKESAKYGFGGFLVTIFSGRS